jgi:hypothetical protein
MGGPGSGNFYHWWRGAKKQTVEGCRSLDASHWMREGILAAGVHQYGSWRWYIPATGETTSTISYEVSALDPSDAWCRLEYTFTASGERVDYRVRLATTRPRFEGLRWWFVCPLRVNGRSCDRRAGKLHLPPRGRYFGCRHCHALTYTSCQQSGQFAGLFRHLAASTGVRPCHRQTGDEAEGEGAAVNLA